MKHRGKKLLAYILVAMLICQLCGKDMLKSLAATISVSSDITVDVDSSDDYVYVSGGSATLTVTDGVTLSGKVDFSGALQTGNSILNNYGTITGNIITGNSTATINNYGTISSSSFNLATGSTLLTTGTVSSVVMEGGDLEVTGGTVGTINDTVGSYISLSNCTVGTVTTGKSINITGTIQATSLSTAGIVSDGDGTASVEVTDYVKVTDGIVDARVFVQKATVIDALEGSGYSVYYNDKQYAIAAGTKGTILDSYGKKVMVSIPDNSHLTMSGASNTAVYLPGESITQITLQSEDGYYFPEDYCSNVTVDGMGSLIATRTSESEVTISYTLSETESNDVTIKVASASLKPREQGTGSIVVEDVHYGAEVVVALKSKTNDVETAKVEYKKKGDPNSKYRETKPTKVGAYVARVTYAENDKYTSCKATTEFHITYLPIPDNSYVIKGTRGENGFYVSNVEVIPLTGYSVANQLDGTYLDSLIFTSSKDDSVIYFQKDETGEKTDGQQIPALKIDTLAPVIDANDGEIYYGESVVVRVSDVNLDELIVNDVNMSFTDGVAELVLASDYGSSLYKIEARDLAGHSQVMNITIAAEWLKDGIIPQNERVRLSLNTAYRLDAGHWNVQGDQTQYSGGQTFYVRTEGEYMFSKE